MPDIWLLLVIAVIAAIAAGSYLVTRRPKPLVYLSPREQRLTGAMARVVGCSLAQALPAVRRELEIAPNQSDETLVKRAAYHYRQELPAATCQVYRDRAAG
jgi:hypothetical protein